MTPAELAALEAFEEAGVRGQIQGAALGTYMRRWSSVEVFALEVLEVLESWPEQSQRQRAWFDVAEAVARVSEPDLKALICGLSRPESQAGFQP